jgi:hypothetical protein
MFSFTGGNDASYQEMYGPDFVNALKVDRMSLFSADLLRSGGFLSCNGIGIMVVNKRKICSKHSDTNCTFDGFRFVL